MDEIKLILYTYYLPDLLYKFPFLKIAIFH